jgi:hypothetical protein
MYKAQICIFSKFSKTFHCYKTTQYSYFIIDYVELTFHPILESNHYIDLDYYTQNQRFSELRRGLLM